MKLPNWFVCLGEALMEESKPPAQFTLTDAEREAVAWAARAADDPTPVAWYAPQIAATLRGLLERLGGER
jgi:hypothetical protein